MAANNRRQCRDRQRKGTPKTHPPRHPPTNPPADPASQTVNHTIHPTRHSHPHSWGLSSCRTRRSSGCSGSKTCSTQGQGRQARWAGEHPQAAGWPWQWHGEHAAPLQLRPPAPGLLTPANTNQVTHPTPLGQHPRPWGQHPKHPSGDFDPQLLKVARHQGTPLGAAPT